MKKFYHYYKGKLVRTSATHSYKFACLLEGTEKPLACSGTLEGASKTAEWYIRLYTRNAAWREKQIKKLEATGKAAEVAEEKRMLGLEQKDLKRYQGYKIVKLEVVEK